MSNGIFIFDPDFRPVIERERTRALEICDRRNE
jgi:hypothetical protein